MTRITLHPDRPNFQYRGVAAEMADPEGNLAALGFEVVRVVETPKKQKCPGCGHESEVADDSLACPQ